MIELRHLTDIQALVAWRSEVIGSVFGCKSSERLLIANRDYYTRHITDGTHIAIIAKCDDADAGCGALCLSDELPSPDNQSGRCAYIMNVYVRKPYRHRGVAHAIITHLIDEARRIGCDKIYLETTPEAEPIYRQIGFNDMTNMLKYDNPKI